MDVWHFCCFHLEYKIEFNLFPDRKLCSSVGRTIALAVVRFISEPFSTFDFDFWSRACLRPLFPSLYSFYTCTRGYSLSPIVYQKVLRAWISKKIMFLFPLAVKVQDRYGDLITAARQVRSSGNTPRIISWALYSSHVSDTLLYKLVVFLLSHSRRSFILVSFTLDWILFTSLIHKLNL